MESEPHQRFWVRIQAALQQRAALPDANATESEVARHAQSELGTDLVDRFLKEYFLCWRYANGQGALCEAEAEALVIQIEGLPPRAAPPAASPTATQPAASTPAPAPAAGAAVAYGDELEEAAERHSAQIEELAAQVKQLVKANDHRAAIRVLEQWVRLQPKDGKAWHKLGFSYGELNDHARALKAYQKRLEIDPSSQVTLSNVGGHLVEQKRYAEAIQRLTQALQIDPEDPDAWAYLARAYRLSKKYSEAVPAYQNACRLNPDAGNRWFWLAQCQEEVKDLPGATQSYIRATQVDPKDPLNWGYLALVQEDTGALADACQSLETALKLKPWAGHRWLNYARVLGKLRRRGPAFVAYWRGRVILLPKTVLGFFKSVLRTLFFGSVFVSVVVGVIYLVHLFLPPTH